MQGKNLFFHSVYVLLLLFCLLGQPYMAGAGQGRAMGLTSPAFDEGGMIPGKYTCDGRDISPPLTWESPPEGTQSFALICDDPDAPAGTWVHWVYYDIPASIRGLPKNVPTRREPDSGGKQGINDFRRIGYGGPCPPGGTHRYFFRLYALDALLNLNPGLTKRELLREMEGHILDRAIFMGKYTRK